MWQAFPSSGGARLVAHQPPRPPQPSVRRWRAWTALATIALCSVVQGCASEDPAPIGLGERPPQARPTVSAGRSADTPGAPQPTPVADEADPQALAELLQAAPSEPLEPTGPGGGSRVATDTGRDEEEAAQPEPPPKPTAAKPTLQAGQLEIQPGLSSPAIERTARGQIYWPLVQKCRDPDGKILPPDAVTLMFTIRVDGTVDPASVAATASAPRFEAAAECVVREFSALPFRGPPASLGGTSRVIATLPSVD